ncbi:MAG: NAD(P)/FAD-dependent oxidoreductase [Acidobacteriota bacterium]|nr:NAD(P)/FAD-dependent oxidoreductase [Acidobacteriota bacterium]
MSARARTFDVIVVGGGPAGSVMAWSLARQGADVLLLERARFPREKVCGDFVEPRGLRILERMGCLPALEETAPLPITHVAMFLRSECAYRGAIPFYGRRAGLPPHGYIIPRDVLDYSMLRCAAQAGATVRQESRVVSVACGQTGVQAQVQRGERLSTHRAQLVVGADGVHSVVARSAELLEDDPRYSAVSQRAYAEGLSQEDGEAAFFFDRELFPGYGWIFPMAGGRANLGVGILSETRDRHSISVPRLFSQFVDKARETDPRYSDLRLSGPPIGGIVKTYGGAGRNVFDRGLLIGDAGCFVDPMTGEGITPAMESALLGSAVLLEALEQGKFGAAFLSSYEESFRHYFGPAFGYVDLCASLMRNEHFGDAWLDAVARGCKLAEKDTDFGRIAGATFGGMELDPIGIAAQIWTKAVGVMAAEGAHSLFGLLSGDLGRLSSSVGQMADWHLSWWRSALSDPAWHASWASDVANKWLRLVVAAPGLAEDPRARGPLTN